MIQKADAINSMYILPKMVKVINFVMCILSQYGWGELYLNLKMF